MIHWLLVDRISSYEIARRLWEFDIETRGDKYPGVVIKKTGKAEWSPTTVRRILTNPLCKGEWYWNKTRRVRRGGQVKQEAVPKEEWIKVDVPAIVDVDTWQRVQEQLTANRTNAKRNAKREYLLRSMVFCTCGRRWTGRYKGKPKKHAYYRCQSTECEYWRKGCSIGFSMHADRLESAVWDYVIDCLRDPETMIVWMKNQLSKRSLPA